MDYGFSSSLENDVGRFGTTESDDERDRENFESLVNNRVPMPHSENGKYLARTVAPALTKALAEVKAA